MASRLTSALRWGGALGARFLGVAPLATLGIVAMTLVSQLAMLLALFLPLKVVILLGSEGMPGYFPPALAAWDREWLIGALSGAALGCFLLHRLAEWLIGKATEGAVARLLATSAKLALFDHQEEVAAGAYRRYSRVLAGMAFVVLAATLVLWAYPAMGGLVLAYALLSGGALSAWYRRRAPRPEGALAASLGLAGSGGFFLAFAFLVVDFVFWTPPGVLNAILALLLVRQVTTRLTSLVTDLYRLHAQRTRLDALFFHGKVLMPAAASGEERGIWSLLEPTRREAWIARWLAEVSDEEASITRVRWLPSGTANVAALLVEVAGQASPWLVRLHETNRHALARHEATLAGEAPQHLPQPALAGVTLVDRYECLLYRLPPGEMPLDGRAREALAGARERLLEATPGRALIERFLGSRPALWQRLTPAVVSRLEVAANSAEDRDRLLRLRRELPELRGALAAMPLTFVNPDLSAETLWLDGDMRPWALNWGRWGLEPVGAGWPLHKGWPERLAAALSQAARQRPELAGIERPRVELAALAHAMEAHYLRQRYSQALQLLPDLLDALDTCRLVRELP